MEPAPAKSQPGIPWPAVACALAGAAVFQFFGNHTRGYIDTASLFRWWGTQWLNPASETQHGFVVLGIAAWLFWRNGRMEGRAPARPRAQADVPASRELGPPLGLLLAALALHALGFVAQQARVSIAALLLFAWGVLALARRSWGRAAAFPLAFLLFAVPVNFLDTAGFWLRLWVVDASAAIARGLGIAVLQNGTQLVSPDGTYHYDVVAACSGVRSLMALAALSLLVGYLTLRPWWVRGGLLLLSLPLAYLGNVARMTVIIVAASVGGQGWGDRAHEAMGVAVFIVVLGGVFAAAGFLERRRPQWAVARPNDPAAPRGDGHLIDDDGSGRRRAWRAATVAGAVVILAVGEMMFLARVVAQGPAGLVGVRLDAEGKNPAELPAFIGTEWIGRRAEVTAVEREILPADTGYARRTYVAVADPGRQVFLSVVLGGRDRTSIHRPELCLVGQGWTIEGAGPVTFHHPGMKSAEFPATLLRVRREVVTPRGREVRPELVAYWFVGGDGVVATNGERLARDAWNRVAHGRADRWAYVLVQTGAADGEDAARARMQEVLDGVLPAFQTVKPGR